ncbi:egg cell-secreted protein 1.3-like [Amaranthus tricolor]|uniref:egg cell-secreted protein 1.3-like n=1 Tax=Amaranthus tricolor TaxID=29722 RepID=UPI0025887B35|nr:egg cell-secreted protein 1.3-like [Amaranthus tricolor]
MTLTLRIFITLLLTLTISTFTTAKTRALLNDLSPTESYTRLNSGDDQSSSGCWDSMLKLQSCSGDLIQFFYNGETYLGTDCCNAMIVIVQDCWPVMLNSLGLTSEEIGVLKGYCDASAPSPPSPPIAPGPTKLQIMDQLLN